MILGTIDRSSARTFGCVGCEIPVPLGCGLSAKFEARGRFPCQEIRKWSMRIRPPSTPATNACGNVAAAAGGTVIALVFGHNATQSPNGI